MVAGDSFEEPFGVGCDLRRGASSPLGRPQNCVPTGAEVVDEHPGVEVDTHYAARSCTTSSSGVTTRFPGSHQVFQDVPCDQEVALIDATEDKNVVRVYQAIS